MPSVCQAPDGQAVTVLARRVGVVEEKIVGKWSLVSLYDVAVVGGCWPVVDQGRALSSATVRLGIHLVTL